jgi:hypothetical protein
MTTLRCYRGAEFCRVAGLATGFLRQGQLKNRRTSQPEFRLAGCVSMRRPQLAISPSGKYILVTDPEQANLLRDTTWSVAPVRPGKRSKLHARAACRALRIKKGRKLHRLAQKVKSKRRARAINGNLLDCRRANLQSLTNSDIRILNRSKPVRKLVGVHHAVPPRWLKTDCHYHASITVAGEKVHLGSWRTLEEAGGAFDAAAQHLYGRKATTNRSLGFISATVTRTKVCRKAARAAKRKVKEHRQKIALEMLKAFEAAKTQGERLAIFKSMGTACRE